MAHLSKMFFPNYLENCKCEDLVHPWNSSCLQANLEMLFSAFKGASLFFALMHGVQYFSMFKKKEKIITYRLLINFLRSLSFGVTYASLFLFLNCCFRNIFGKFNSIIFMYLVPFCCGLPIFMDTPERRNITVTTFMSMFFEAVYKMLLNRKIMKRSKEFETVLFMIINAFLMKALRLQQDLGGKKSNMWFLRPHPLRNENIISDDATKICTHKNSCRENIIRGVLKYGSIGLIMSGIRFTVYNLMSPINNWKSLLQWKILQLPCFMILYVFIFQAMSCLLCKKEGKDNYEHTFWSGLLSGISYWFSPNFPILFTALAVLLKITGKQAKDKYNLPNLPYPEMCFVLSNMFLLQRLIFDFESVPTFFYNLIHFGTMKKAAPIIEAVHKQFGIRI